MTDPERIQRFRSAGYGGNVSDALGRLGVFDTVLSERFKPIRKDMILVGRALPVKIHTLAQDNDELFADKEIKERLEAERFPQGHPQKLMMRCVADQKPGSVLCFDCGGDVQAAHFGEMSCQVAYAHGCRGMLLAGNCRDTQYILKMKDFPIFSFGTRPNFFGGWIVIDINVPIMLPGHLTHYTKIFPGDYIFGDNDGVQVIPSEIVDEVLLQVENTHAEENAERKLLAEGMPIDEVYRRFGVL
ncbi:MAG: RraA family protein [Clostridiales bacterium]|nr:RraA family protein [Clostridiales bacterium]